MIQLKPTIPHHESIKNIIFDFGGVICNLDIKRSIEKFKNFGLIKAEFSGTPSEQERQFELLCSSYETGLITSKQFIDTIRNYYQRPPSDQAISEAWNALLLEIPEPRVRLLESLRERFRIFLLSNSNEIHYLKYREDFQQQYGYQNFDSLFEKVYFSYLLHLKKPDQAIFKIVLDENNLEPFETLFIDDTIVNTMAAQQLGIIVYHLQEGQEITNLFEKP